jgi:hypothetical protein
MSYYVDAAGLRFILGDELEVSGSSDYVQVFESNKYGGRS